MSKNLAGIFPSVTAPFAPSGEVLIDKFRTNCERWAGYGLAGQRAALASVLYSVGVRETRIT